MPTGPGYADACTTHLPLGRPGLVTLTTAPPAGQAATGEAGTRPTTARTRPARVDRTSDRHRPRGTGPVKRRAADSDADARPSRTARKLTGSRDKAGAPPAAQGERGGARWAWRVVQVPASGPDQRPKFDYPHHGSDGSAPEEGSGPWLAL